MTVLLHLLLIIILAFTCGALLTWPVYEVLQWFTEVRFNKLMSHVITLCAFVFIFLLLRYYKSLDRDTIGFRVRTSDIPAPLLHGIVAGILIMGVLEILLYGLGVHKTEPELQPGTGFFLLLTLKAIVSGIVVAILEETLYRGALLGFLLRKTGILFAVLLSSVIYSAVHFLSFPAVAESAGIHLMTGIILLPQAFVRFSDPAILEAFLALTMFGILLSLLRIHNGNIVQCIGLHAGVVIAIKYIKELTDYAYGNQYAVLVSSFDHLLGYLALFWLTVLTLGYFCLTRQKICNNPDKKSISG